jgi:hypothetical protein
MAPAVAENLQRRVVVPVVDDATEDVSVAAGRHRLEEVPGDDLRAPGQLRNVDRLDDEGTRPDEIHQSGHDGSPVGAVPA